jgi:hypothetical protein
MLEDFILATAHDALVSSSNRTLAQIDAMDSFRFNGLFRT